MLKLATPEQTEFYENILYPMQDEIFTLLQSDKFYLTGGTCLSRFYYQHRYSEDLDFFFMGDTFRKEDFEAEFTVILKKIYEKYKVEVSVNAEYFKRLLVYKNNQELKIEFIYDVTPVIGDRIKKDAILLDTKGNIVTNKITAIQGRKTYKDYFDLFFLLKEYDLKDVVKWAETKMIPLNYEGMFLALVDGNLRGDVFMIKEISLTEFKEFENKLMKDLLNHAKTIP